jgi:hypothetical protein
MLKKEFCALIGDDWKLCPAMVYRRLTDGTIQHHTMNAYNPEVRTNHMMLSLPERYQEDSRIGTEINLRADQLRVLDSWAQAGQVLLAGVLTYVDSTTIEYWMPLTIDPIADEPMEMYLANLQAQWQAEIRKTSPRVPRHLTALRYSSPSRCVLQETCLECGLLQKNLRQPG